MPTLRTQPYIWTTWISKILGGDNSCEWSAWYRAQHQDIPKRDRSDMDTPRIKHTALLQYSKSRFEKEGYRVFIEDQNSFKLKGRVATLGGKPDLIAIGNDEYLICDVKTGQPSITHRMQVMIYMFAMPLAIERFKGVSFSGVVIYEDYHEYISPKDLNETFTGNLVSLINRVGGKEPLQRVPSFRECRWCDLTEESCDARVTTDDSEGETDLF